MNTEFSIIANYHFLKIFPPKKTPRRKFVICVIEQIKSNQLLAQAIVRIDVISSMVRSFLTLSPILFLNQNSSSKRPIFIAIIMNRNWKRILSLKFFCSYIGLMSSFENLLEIVIIIDTSFCFVRMKRI